MKAFAVLVGALVYACVVLFAVAVGLEFAYVESVLWQWFAIPRGLPPVSLTEFFGFSCLLALFRAKPPLKSETEDKRTASEKAVAMVGFVTLPWLVLFMAWLVAR